MLPFYRNGNISCFRTFKHCLSSVHVIGTHFFTSWQLHVFSVLCLPSSQDILENACFQNVIHKRKYTLSQWEQVQLLRGPVVLITFSLKRTEKMFLIQPVDICDSHLCKNYCFILKRKKSKIIKSLLSISL